MAKKLETFARGHPESLNPDLPIDEQTDLLPYDQRWEFPRAHLKLGTATISSIARSIH